MKEENRIRHKRYKEKLLSDPPRFAEFKRRQAKSSKKRKDRDNKVKKQLVEYKGGKCSICGYNKCLAVLSFHHMDKTKKELKFNRSYHKEWKILKEEVDKCILVCANCHGEIHNT